MAIFFSLGQFFLKECIYYWVIFWAKFNLLWAIFCKAYLLLGKIFGGLEQIFFKPSVTLVIGWKLANTVGSGGDKVALRRRLEFIA